MITKSKGIQAQVWTVEAGGNRAVIFPEVGGNLIGLTLQGTEVLRAYAGYEEIAETPTAYGLPILFPPNRIDGGRFSYAGKTYQFDVNEPETGNSLHGFLQDKPWAIEALKDTEEEAVVRLSYSADRNSPFYRVYPVSFLAEILYTLNEGGLTQEVRITNTGAAVMPYGIGWHSAFRIGPTTKMRVSVKERVQLSDRMLPTGRLLPLSDDEKTMRTTGLSPLYAVMDDHFTAEPIDGFHGAELIHEEENVKVVYEVDSLYRHWMIWNNSQEGSFVCIEPQNWRVNAPNLPLTADESGMAGLEAGATVSAAAHITVRPLKQPV